MADPQLPVPLLEALQAHELHELRHLRTTRLTECFVARKDAGSSLSFVKLLKSPHPARIAAFEAEIDSMRILSRHEGFPCLVASSRGHAPPFHITKLLLLPRLDRMFRAVAPSESEAVWLIRAIADRLATLHGLNIAHGDVAADHIFLDPRMRATLTDFGLSTRLDDVGPDRRRQLMGADIRAMAMVILFLLTGRASFSTIQGLDADTDRDARACVDQLDVSNEFRTLLAMGLWRPWEFRSATEFSSAFRPS